MTQPAVCRAAESVIVFCRPGERGPRAALPACGIIDVESFHRGVSAQRARARGRVRPRMAKSGCKMTINEKTIQLQVPDDAQQRIINSSMTDSSYPSERKISRVCSPASGAILGFSFSTP